MKLFFTIKPFRKGFLLQPKEICIILKKVIYAISFLKVKPALAFIFNDI